MFSRMDRTNWLIRALSPALAGTRRACRAGEKSHLREICFFRDFMGLQKTKIFLVTFGLASLYRSSTSSNIQAAAFAAPLCKDKQC